MKRFSFALAFLLPLSFFFLRGFSSFLPVLLPALWHEAGHLLAAFFLKIPLKSAAASVSGFSFTFSAPLQSYKKDALLALSGPFANLLAAAVLIPLLRRNPSSFWFTVLFADLSLLIANLLPLAPLDGGRALYAFLSLKFSPDRAAQVLRFLCPVILLPLTLFGIYLFRLGEGTVLFFAVLLWAETKRSF